MRSVFDQYQQWENRLTHALACSLHHDQRFLRAFVHWATGMRVTGKLTIVEQAIPDAEPVESEIRRTSLPDAWVTSDDGWCLLIESKVTAQLKVDQLQRHAATAKRQGFQRIEVLALTLHGRDIPDRAIAHHRTWTDLYEWLQPQLSRSSWARLMSEYMEAFERRTAAEGHLVEGSVTRFSGIRIDDENPYTYREAKRLLGLALQELRGRRDLLALGVDPKHPGRSAITGSHSRSVWDFLALKDPRVTNSFTKLPHLTLNIGLDAVTAMMTIPNGLESGLRRNLTALDLEAFRDLLADVRGRLLRGLRGVMEASPRLYVLQRHYKTQRSAPITDARLDFDLRTMDRNKSPVKAQPEWVAALHSVVINRRANLQLGIGAHFPIDCPALHGRSALDHLATAWIGCKPVLDVVMNGAK